MHVINYIISYKFTVGFIIRNSLEFGLQSPSTMISMVLSSSLHVSQFKNYIII